VLHGNPERRQVGGLDLVLHIAARSSSSSHVHYTERGHKQDDST